MPINTSWNKVTGLGGSILFNVNIADGVTPDYYPMQIQLNVSVATDDGEGGKREIITKNLGTNQPAPFILSTIEGLKALHTALPSFIQAAFKDAIVESINEDASA